MKPIEGSEIANPLGTDKISSLLFKFAIPSIIAMLVSALYNIVDQIFIGQAVGYLGNAATNVAFPLTTICLAIALLIGNGGAANQSIFLGAGEEDKAQKIVGNSIFLLILSGVSLLVIVLVFLKPMMLFFGATKEVLPYSITYTSITALGFPFLILANGMNSFIRADGSPKYAMTSMLVGTVLNIILNPIFIFGFGLGVAGSAWATVISQILSCIMVLIYIPKFKHIKISLPLLKLKKKLCKAIFSLGAASCINQLAMFITQVVMNNSLTYYGAQSIYGSDIPLACSGIINKVSMVFLSIVIGLAIGSQPLIGFNYGAKQYNRVRETYKLAVTSATGISIVAFLLFQLFPRPIISLFGAGSPEYFQFAEAYFRIFLMFTFINGIQPVTGNFFTYMGKAKKGVFITLTRQILFLIPLIVILPLFLGINGIMYAGPIADCTAAIVAIVMVYKEMKKLGNKASHQSDNFNIPNPNISI